MIKASFQCRIFLLTVLLHLWLSQVYSYIMVWKNEKGFQIGCDEMEHLDSQKLMEDSKKIVKGTKHESTLKIYNCPPPSKTYLETLEKININASRIAAMRISFPKMNDTYLLKESLFAGMPLKKLLIKGIHYAYDVSIELSEKLDLAKVSKYNLKCKNDHDNKLINLKPLFPNRIKNVSLVKFYGCSTPNVGVSYFDILLNLNIIPSSVKELALAIDPRKNNLKPDNFKGLSLLKLSVIYYTIFELDPELFQEIAVDEVYLESVTLKMLQKFRVKRATLVGGKFVGEWGDCSTLALLNLIRFDVLQISDGWLRPCCNLTDLTVAKVSQKGLEKILMGANALINLTVESCEIHELTKRFAENSVNLRKLTIKEHVLSYIHTDAFGALEKLEELDLSWTRLSGFLIMQAITPLQNLRKLTLERNPVEAFCSDYRAYISSTPMKRNITQGVESLSIRNSPLSDTTCFSDWVNLNYLNLSFNSIFELDLLSLPVPHKHHLIVDLRGNKLQRPSILNDYKLKRMKMFKTSQNITILLDWTVNCDCEHSQIIQVLRDLPQIKLQNATCSSGERLVDFSEGEKFRCDKYICANCTCRTSWVTNFTIVDCNLRRLFTLPAVWQYRNSIDEIVVTKISAAGNFIKTLPAIDIDQSLLSSYYYWLHSKNLSMTPANLYPKTLDEINLSNSSIARLSESTLNVLFSGGNLVYLSGNPFVCDCESQTMLEALRMHSDQIPDYNNIKCINGNTYIHKLSERFLCAETVVISLPIYYYIICSSLLVSAVITRYIQTIKAFLYARGSPVYCVTEKELDADKEYDAFISFAGLDDKLVAKELLPRLENDYKLCVHTRNWIPGEFIYTQIIESVENSRRTVVVLTKNFVESVWGILEFRTAYNKALREGRVRVICILVDDDIHDMDLAPDLKDYLKTNTYLKLRDPWFWQKLRYSLPHPSVNNQSGQPNESEDNGNQKIKLTSKQDDGNIME